MKKEKKETFEQWRKRDDARRTAVAARAAAKRLEAKKRPTLNADKAAKESPKVDAPSLLEVLAYGGLNKHMICPHCQVKGTIRTKRVKVQAGVSGSKAAAALLTGGWSLLAVGLSRKQQSTQAKCGTCKNIWIF